MSTALVTGGSRGIGRSLARSLRRRGFDVVITGRNAVTLEEVVRAGDAHRFIVLDASDTTTSVRTIRALDEEVGGLDLVIAQCRGRHARSRCRAVCMGVDGGCSPHQRVWCGRDLDGGAARDGRAGPRAHRGHRFARLVRRAPGVGGLLHTEERALDVARLSSTRPRGHPRHRPLPFTSASSGPEMVARSTHPLPQLLEPEAVGERIAAALERRPRTITMPLALAAATFCLARLPRSTKELLARRLR